MRFFAFLGFVLLHSAVLSSGASRLSVRAPTVSSRGSDRIAYVAHGQIWLADLSGEPIRALSGQDVLASNPDWSRSGKLAFLETGPNQVIRVRTENADGNGLKTIFTTTPQSSASGPIWSTDSKSIAFGYQGAVYVMRSDGRHVEKLAGAMSMPDVSAWSADGRYVLFDAMDLRPGHASAQLFEVPAAGGSKPRNVTPVMFRKKGARALSAKWMPDHKRIAFLGFDPAKGPRTQIYVFDPRKPRVNPKPLMGNPGESYEDDVFSFSPDGKHIVFGRSPSELGVPSIWIAGIDGSNARVLITQPDPEPHSGVDSPAWSWTSL